MKNILRSAARNRSAVAKLLLWIGAVFVTSNVSALTFPLPSDGNIVGQIQHATVRPGENLSTIGRRFDIGGYEMKEANPGVDYMNPGVGRTLVIPSRFVLPNTSRKGIVINLSEMRLYYYHPDGRQVSTFPVGVGQEGWDTPLGESQIVRKRENPTWVVPDSILENHKRLGKYIAPIMPPGPKNPLGQFAMTTGFKNIVIHGSPYPMGVGVRSSHGCIRMLNENIRELYHMVPVGTKVTIVHEPNKLGYLGNQVFLESHVPISNTMYTGLSSTDTLVQRMANKLGKKITIKHSEAQRLRSQPLGYPALIGNIF
ncbi:L,D-transpeptidase family protein [Candidatus Berkiella cookevillensis]|uniref:L,D-transpeptidase family protein n=1 Tax=Candidatus Berkiella cookevillensis TaxID=437022 RepID=A0A0Q9YGP9_9GAMM|nr:L,D-transpeptidase family protein [Candidatus Berkiella cookevillensis]MCS5709661.1 L,D-transpeptidase family protein [Candidatus Berkiella cookevillensis]